MYNTIFETLPPLLLGVLFLILLPDVRDAQVWVQPVQRVGVEVGETEAQRGHTAQFVDFCNLLDDTLPKTNVTMKKKSMKRRGGNEGTRRLRQVRLTLTSVPSPCLMLLAQVHGSLFVSK